MKNLSALSLSPSDTAPPFNTVTDGSLQVQHSSEVRQEVSKPCFHVNVCERSDSLRQEEAAPLIRAVRLQ